MMTKTAVLVVTCATVALCFSLAASQITTIDTAIGRFKVGQPRGRAQVEPEERWEYSFGWEYGVLVTAGGSLNDVWTWRSASGNKQADSAWKLYKRLGGSKGQGAFLRGGTEEYELLNTLGAKGWEICAGSDNVLGGTRIWFKRPG